MYLEHFGLATNPFSLSPKLDFLYKSTAFEESMAHLIYGLDNSEAIVMITGAIGSGKTMALQSFMANLGDRFDFALVTNTQVSTVELLKLVLDDLEVKFSPGYDKSDLLILFKDFLFEASRYGRRVIIIIDAAQNLPMDVLEEVRLLTNLGQGESQPVQIVLVGQPELLNVVNDPALAQLRQRIRVHYSFEALTRKELDGYLVHRLSVAGCRTPVFKHKAVNRIYELSAGVPRVVNTLAGEALLSAFVGGRKQVEAQDVEQLPDAFPETSGSKIPAPDLPSVSSSTSRSHAEKTPEAKPQYAQKRTAKRRVSRWALVAVTVLLAGAFWVIFTDPGGVVSRYSEAIRGWGSTVEYGTEIVQAQVVEAEPLANHPELTKSSESEPVPSESVGTASSVDTFRVASPMDGVEVQKPMPMGDEYLVHIASFKENQRAEAYLESIGRQGVPAKLESQVVRGEQWYRVYLGPFETEEDAQTAIDSIKDKERIRYYLISKSPSS